MRPDLDRLEALEKSGETTSRDYWSLLFKTASAYAERGLYERSRELLRRPDFYDFLHASDGAEATPFFLQLFFLRLEVFLERHEEAFFLYDLQWLSGALGRMDLSAREKDEWAQELGVFRARFDWQRGLQEEGYLRVNEVIRHSTSATGPARRRLYLLRGRMHVERLSYGEAVVDLDNALNGVSTDLSFLIPGHYWLFRAWSGLGKFSSAKKHFDEMRGAFEKRDLYRKFEGWIRNAEAEFKTRWSG